MNLRRWVLVIAALGAMGVLVVVARPSSSGPQTPGPNAPLSLRGPVLLVPGYGGDRDGLAEAARTLSAYGTTARVVDIGDGTGDLTAYAKKVVAQASALVRQGAPSVDLVGYSAGGLVARAAATSTDGQPLVRRVVTVGTPHAGTDLATLGAAFNACPTACRQMEPGSAFLKGLPTANDPSRWLSMWSTSDEAVQPVTSSDLPGATDLPLQDTCPGPVAHDQLMQDPLVLAAMTGFLANGTVPTTCPR